MANLNILEELRTRKEVEDYFKKLGKEITEEEIDELKQNYDKTKENNKNLTLEQLDDVAGGFYVENGNIKLGKIYKVSKRTKIYTPDLGVVLRPNGNIFYIDCSNVVDSGEKILENTNYLPVFFFKDTGKDAVLCYPIDRNAVDKVFMEIVERRDLAAECNILYSIKINAQLIIAYGKENSSSLTSYDQKQLDNLSRLVEDDKEFMPPAPAA